MISIFKRKIILIMMIMMIMIKVVMIVKTIRQYPSGGRKGRTGWELGPNPAGRAPHPGSLYFHD